MMAKRVWMASICLAVLAAGCSGDDDGDLPDNRPPALTDAERCTQLGTAALAGAPVPRLVVTASTFVPTGTLAGANASLPSHCLVEGYFGERAGLVGGPYRTGFRMRLPVSWNGRFFFQGGGGSNGVVGDATGPNGTGNPSALARFYAVIAQDSGHDNDRNTLPDYQGNLVFGHDPQARRDYGHTSLKPVYDLGQHLIRTHYGRASQYEIFWGCSKGGQEGMAFAQRYPEAFDGIVAAAPGFALPRAALAQAWDTQAMAGIFAARGQTPSVAGYNSLFTAGQFALVSTATLAACDGLDGATDGMVAAIGQCTTARVEPELRRRQCAPGATGTCLEPAQIDAMITIMDGAQGSTGEQLYAPWPWDAGVGTPGWNVWKSTLNIALGGGSLSAVFTTPPTPLANNNSVFLDWLLAFDFDRDTDKLYAVQAPFTTSAWDDVGMRSPDLARFRAHGGKLLVPHGSADPVFSVLDTIAWWNEVDATTAGNAASFTRVFPVPGMNHCGGGPATDSYDSLTALENWVIAGRAPDSIPARAGANTPFPGRQMPLCPYPQVALPVAGAAGTYACGRL